MHGMLSAAIILIVFALVAAIGGGSAVWLYRAAAVPSGRSRRSAENAPQLAEPAPESTPAGPESPEPVTGAVVTGALESPETGPAPGTHGDDSGPVDDPVDAEPRAPVAEIEASPRTPLPPLRPALAAPPADEPSGAGPATGAHSGEHEVLEGARIYLLDSSRRSGR